MPGEGRAGLEVEAARQLDRNDRDNPSGATILRQRFGAGGVGAGRQADVKALADPQHVAAVEVPDCKSVDSKWPRGPAAVESVSPTREAAPGPGDDRMLAEQQRRVLDEHRVGIVGAGRAGGRSRTRRPRSARS